MGGSFSASINVIGDHDWYRVNLNANTLYTIQVSGMSTYGVPTGTLAMYDANGNALSAADATGIGGLGFMPATTGTYFIDVGGSNYSATTPAAYTLTVADQNPNDMRNNVSTTGVLSDADTIAPTVTAFGPIDEAIGVATSSNIVLTYSETIQRGSGNILLKTATGNVVATYDAASSTNLSISGSTLTINPSADLGIFTGYQVEIAAGAIKEGRHG